ncbi:MAG: hypothetical protein ACREIS_09690, partial [Nitrospiraceae bacterium]
IGRVGHPGNADGVEAQSERLALDHVGEGHTYFLWEQSNRTLKMAEQCSVLQRLQVPVMRVLQSVAWSSNRQVVAPPLEMVVQGFVVPGKLATTHPGGNGTEQLCLSWPLPMPKLQENSVVAVESPSDEAA